MARRPARPLAVALAVAVLAAAVALLAWRIGEDETAGESAVAVERAATGSEVPARPLARQPAPSERVAQATPAAPADEPEKVAPERQLPPPGCIDVLVLLDGEPAQGALVLVAGQDDGGLNRMAEPWDRGVRSARTGADGRTRFAELPVDSFDVEAQIDGLGAVRRRDVAYGRRVGAVVVLELGTGAIEGRAWNARGEAAADAWVEVVGDLLRRGALTDVAGAYRVGGLPAGPHMVAGPGGQHTALVFELAAGETKRIDFGGPYGRTTWRGVLRTTSGAPVPLATNVHVEPVRAEHEPIQGHVQWHAFQTQSDGSFEAALLPGTYRVFAALRHPPLDTGLVELGLAPLERDLVAPGVTLTGTLAYAGSELERASAAEHATILLGRADGGGAENCPYRAGDRYAFYGLEPGSYVLRCPRFRVAGLPDGMPVEIDGERSVVVVDVSLEDRR